MGRLVMLPFILIYWASEAEAGRTGSRMSWSCATGATSADIKAFLTRAPLHCVPSTET